MVTRSDDEIQRQRSEEVARRRLTCTGSTRGTHTQSGSAPKGIRVTAIAFVIGVAGTVAFAGGLPTPSASLILESAAWLALANAVVCVVAIGLGSLTGSRPGTITALVGWQLVLSPLLLRAGSLGSIRRGLLDGVVQFLNPGPANGAPTVAMSAGVAIAVLALWTLVIPSLGAWRLRTRDA